MFKLVLTNGIEDKELIFTIYDTPIAQKWKTELSKNYALHETDRFTNWSKDNSILKLNECIAQINKYDPIINKCILENSNTLQQDLNYLHKFFEDLRGEVETGTDWFNRAPKEIQASVEKFNILIHKLEANTRTTNHPTVVVTFKDRPRFELTDDDCKQFTFRWKRGTVYINYCHVGKTVLDTFKDKDNLAEGVRPQTHYSADFMIKFGPTIPYPAYILRKAIISIWMKFKKINPKTANLGMIPVATCTSKFVDSEIVKFDKVKEIQCLN